MADSGLVTNPPARQEQPVARPNAPSANETAQPRATTPRWRHWLANSVPLYIVLLTITLIIVVTNEWNRWTSYAASQTTDDAYLQADTTPLAAKVSGYVRRVLVQDYQTVKAGDTLVELVDDDYRAQLAQADAGVAAAQAAIDTIGQQRSLQQTLVQQAQATIEATQADLTRYHLEAVRQKTLLQTKIAGTPQLTEQAVDNEAHAAATLALNHAQLDQQRGQIQVLDSQQKQAQASLAAQRATRDLATINLGYTRITAPVDGMVGQRLVQAGQYLNVGTQVMSIVPLPNVWVIANYKETQLTRIRVGQPARVTVDTFPGKVLHGHVDSWSPASGAQFSLLPPDNATGNFTKVVQRIPVKIVLDPDPELATLLRPGMSVVATIDTKAIPTQ
jgi:membrane fusion protein, multidrug efflux system